MIERFDPYILEHAADLISQADALTVAAGAGMGVDSGLPRLSAQSATVHPGSRPRASPP